MKSFAENNGALTIRLGTEADRQTIYAMRHAVYATELGQHAENEQGELTDSLDEFNVFRFNELLRIIGEQSQIVMITHNKRSMEFADTLFGVTMEKKGISKIVSVSLERREAA